MAQSPALFYSDLPGGMCTGGRDNLGHIITIFGKNFGSVQDGSHYVTIAGAQAASYLLWQDDKIAFQPGCGVPDGDYTITVTTSAGTSNALPFHIYSGANIYFLDQVNGNDANTGDFAAPFKTLTKCRTMAAALAGSTCYLMPGTVQKVVDTQPGSYSAFLNMSVKKGLPEKYIGVIGYPTADPNLVPKIGCDYLGGDCPTSSVMGVRVYDESYAVVANLHVYFSKPYPGLQVGGPALAAHHIRIANLEFTSQNTDYIMAVQTIEASFVQFYGLYIHDIYDPNDSKHVGGIYVGESAHDIDIGWTIEDFSCAYNATNPCHINKMIEFHATRQYVNIPPPTLTAGMVAAVGNSAGTLPAGTYDVQLTYRSRIYSPSHTVPSATETTASAVQKIALDGTATNAIRITAPAGYDHLPTWDDGVSVLCNPALAYRVYICRENGGACTPQYQGESAYSNFTSPGSSTAAAYTQTAALSSGTAPPTTNTTEASGCNIYNVAVHDSRFNAAPGYTFPIGDVGTDKGYIRFYNNEILNSGNNSAMLGSELLANMCFYVMDQDPDARDHAAGGDIEFYNNTFYNCGKPGGNSQGVFMFYWPDSAYPLKRIVLRNNIFVQPQSGQAWLSAGSTPNGPNAQILGSNNLCYGYAGSNCPAAWNSEAGAVHADPLFTAAGTPTADPSGTGGIAYFGANLTPRVGSPAIDAGYDTTATVGHDRVGVLRPQNSIVDIGPYEYFAGVTVDSVPPVVSLSSPIAGTVSGSITLTATCSDNVAVSTMQFTVDDANYGSSFTGAGQHSQILNTTALVNGGHTIGATCTDTSGNTATAAPVAVTVSNLAQRPTFSPVPGTYHSAESVTLSDATPGTKIYYTTNGTTPTTASTVYTAPISVTTTMTIKAIAAGGGYGASTAAWGNYAITALPPTFSPVPTTYHTPQSVSLSDATPGTTIYYTTNGTTPTTASTVYTGPISVTTTMTIKAIAAGGGYGASTVAWGNYAITALPPTFSPVPTTYHTPQSVSLSDATSGTKIYYTTNGTTPTTASTVYTGPIAVATTTTIKAIAAGGGYGPSTVATGRYAITALPPTFSPVPTTYHTPQSVSLADATPGTKIYYTTNGTTPTTASTVYTGPIAVTTTTTIKAIAAGGGYGVSTVSTGRYTITALPPTFSPVPTTYYSPQSVTLSDATPGTKIYYTTNDTTPTTASTVYTGPIAVAITTTIKAIAAGGGYASSTVTTGTYTIQ